jgi:hypothetical protein
MTDAEISRRLALAIGWPFAKHSPTHPWALVGHDRMTGSLIFDYRNPLVIWPIAERFNCFPMRVEGGWGAFYGVCFYTADTAAKAVALAVIKHHEGSKTA